MGSLTRPRTIDGVCGASAPTWELVWEQLFHKAGGGGCCPFDIGVEPSLSQSSCLFWNPGVGGLDRGRKAGLALLSAAVGSGAQHSPHTGIVPPPKQNFLEGRLAF